MVCSRRCFRRLVRSLITSCWVRWLNEGPQPLAVSRPRRAVFRWQPRKRQSQMACSRLRLGCVRCSAAASFDQNRLIRFAEHFVAAGSEASGVWGCLDERKVHNVLRLMARRHPRKLNRLRSRLTRPAARLSASSRRNGDIWRQSRQSVFPVVCQFRHLIRQLVRRLFRLEPRLAPISLMLRLAIPDHRLR